MEYAMCAAAVTLPGATNFHEEMDQKYYTANRCEGPVYLWPSAATDNAKSFLDAATRGQKFWYCLFLDEENQHEPALLEGAQLNGLYLQGASLERISLRGANLKDSNLQGSRFVGTDLTGADLTGADLRHAQLADADLTGVNFRGANLRGAELPLVMPEGACFEEADLRGALVDGLRTIQGIKDWSK